MAPTWKQIQFALDRNLREAATAHDRALDEELDAWDRWFSGEDYEEDDEDEEPTSEIFYLPDRKLVEREVRNQERREDGPTKAYLKELGETGRVRANTDAITSLLVERIEFASIMADMIYELEEILGPPALSFSQTIHALTVDLWNRVGRKAHVAQWAANPDVMPTRPTRLVIHPKTRSTWYDIALALNAFEAQLYDTIVERDEAEDPDHLQREDIYPLPPDAQSAQEPLAHFIHHASSGFSGEACLPDLSKVTSKALRHLYTRFAGVSRMADGIANLPQLFLPENQAPHESTIQLLADHHWLTQRKPKVERLLREAPLDP